jgi:hypothetical protein
MSIKKCKILGYKFNDAGFRKCPKKDISKKPLKRCKNKNFVQAHQIRSLRSSEEKPNRAERG